MTRESARTKAARYLAEGRLILDQVDSRTVRGACRGDGAIYTVSYERGQWACTCPAKTDQCAHLIAARSVVAVDLEWGY